jgi:hypothetical protein
MTRPRKRWLDRDAGPVVRPYALTKGRTRPQGETFDLIDVVAATGTATTEKPWLGPEHQRILLACRRPVVVADVASDIDLPLAVVRVLLSDLNQEGLITVLRPATESPINDLTVMRNVLDGLKAL